MPKKNFTTIAPVSAAVKLIPNPPALVLNRKIKISGL
jgi:hypothetical protein